MGVQHGARPQVSIDRKTMRSPFEGNDPTIMQLSKMETLLEEIFPENGTANFNPNYLHCGPTQRNYGLDGVIDVVFNGEPTPMKFVSVKWRDATSIYNLGPKHDFANDPNYQVLADAMKERQELDARFRIEVIEHGKYKAGEPVGSGSVAGRLISWGRSKLPGSDKQPKKPAVYLADLIKMQGEHYKLFLDLKEKHGLAANNLWVSYREQFRDHMLGDSKNVKPYFAGLMMLAQSLPMVNDSRTIYVVPAASDHFKLSDPTSFAGTALCFPAHYEFNGTLWVKRTPATSAQSSTPHHASPNHTIPKTVVERPIYDPTAA